MNAPLRDSINISNNQTMIERTLFMSKTNNKRRNNNIIKYNNQNNMPRENGVDCSIMCESSSSMSLTTTPSSSPETSPLTPKVVNSPSLPGKTIRKTIPFAKSLKTCSSSSSSSTTDTKPNAYQNRLGATHFYAPSEIKYHYTRDPPKRVRKVNFSTVQIRNYNMTLGDNPACRHGLPVTLDWDYEECSPIKVNHFESSRVSQRRPVDSLVLSSNERYKILNELGIPKQEQKQAEKILSKIQRQRTMTTAITSMAFLRSMEQVADVAGRNLKRVLPMTNATATRQNTTILRVS